MGSASKYWTLVKLDVAGGCKIEVMAEAKAFFNEVFVKEIVQGEVLDDSIQRQLHSWMLHSSKDEPAKSVWAERCLLCFISHQIELVCRQLESQFGTTHGFTYQDLLPFVLADDGRWRRVNPDQPISDPKSETTDRYQSTAQVILKSFEPDQSSLATWTTRRVKHHPELNAFLLEQGVYMISDWAILNDTRPKQLEKILVDFYQSTPFEVKQARELLESYHAIYRRARLQERTGGSKRQCQPPTPEQLQQMAQILAEKTELKYSQKMVMALLQKLATRLRNYRISVRGGSPKTESLDISSQDGALINKLGAAEPAEDEGQDEQLEFLKFYRQQFSVCLAEAIAAVTQTWVQQLQRQGSQKSGQFLTALQLFHCRGQTMGEIAAGVGLQAQYQVTRLLKLKAFRTDVRHQLLGLLRDRIVQQVKAYLEPERLLGLDRQIEEALDEQINTMMQEAETEASMAKNRPASSVFSRKLCSYLDNLSW